MVRQEFELFNDKIIVIIVFFLIILQAAGDPGICDTLMPCK